MKHISQITLITAFMAGTVWAGKVEYSGALDQPLARCNQIVNQSAVSDWVACPQVEQYVFSDSNELKQFLEDGPYAARKTNLQSAQKLISQSILTQANGVADDDVEVATVLRGLTKRIQKYLATADETDADTYVDDNTQWAPSVDGVAVILVNRNHYKVTIILHGDADG
jgi:hypothetical protein